MIIGSVSILIILAFILFSIIGIFNKKIGRFMRMITFYLKNLRLTKRNITKLPKTAKKIYPVLRRRRTLFIIKLFQNYQKNKKTNTKARDPSQ